MFQTKISRSEFQDDLLQFVETLKIYFDVGKNKIIVKKMRIEE